MKNLIKYLLIAFLGFCLTGGVLGEWYGTFYVDVTEGDLECDYPSYVGDVACYISGGGGSDSKTWTGYGVYTFHLYAPNSGYAFGVVDLNDGFELVDLIRTDILQI